MTNRQPNVPASRHRAASKAIDAFGVATAAVGIGVSSQAFAMSPTLSNVFALAAASLGLGSIKLATSAVREFVQSNPSDGLTR